MPRCNVCNNLFASRQSLSNHRKRIHSKVLVPPGVRKSAVEDGAKTFKGAGKVITGKNDKIEEQEQLTKPENFQFAPKVEDSDTESSSDDESFSESLPDDSEKVKALFRQLYKELHHNIKRYRKLIRLSSRLWKMGCLTYEEYSELIENLQKKIGML